MKQVTSRKEIAMLAEQLTSENKAYAMAVIRALVFAQDGEGSKREQDAQESA